MRLLVLGSLLVGAALPAHAEQPAERVLRLLDAAMNTADDQSFEYDVSTWEPGKNERVMSMNVKVKSPGLRRVDFVAPGDVKGMRVLVRSLSEMYVYLPSFHKIRRVAGHVRSQSFMGSALSQDDMSISRYGEAYVATRLVREDGTSWTIQLTRRPRSDFPYATLQITVLKKERMPSEILYFNDASAKVKSEQRPGYSCKTSPKGQVCNAYEMRMTDHTRNGLWTKLIMKKWTINTGVPEAFFTPRDLQRGG